MNSYGPMAISIRPSTAHAFAVTLHTPSLLGYHCSLLSASGCNACAFAPSDLPPLIGGQNACGSLHRQVLSVFREPNHRGTFAAVRFREEYDGAQPISMSRQVPVIYSQVPTAVTRASVSADERSDLITDVVVHGEPSRPERAMQ
jgi:hypothetical protein